MKSKNIFVFFVIFFILLVFLIAYLVVGNDQTPKSRARDAKRYTDMINIQRSLDLYFSDKKIYPSDLNDLTPDYISVIPTNPRPNDRACPNSFEYGYKSLSDGMTYQLEFCLGNDLRRVKAGHNIVNKDIILE